MIFTPLFEVVTFGVLISSFLLSIRYKHAQNADTNDDLNFANRTQKRISAIVFRVLISLIICYSPYVAMSWVKTYSWWTGHTLLKGRMFAMIWFLCWEMDQANSFVNSLIFFAYNRKCRNKALSLFSCTDRILSVRNQGRNVRKKISLGINLNQQQQQGGHNTAGKGNKSRLSRRDWAATSRREKK